MSGYASLQTQRWTGLAAQNALETPIKDAGLCCRGKGTQRKIETREGEDSAYRGTKPYCVLHSTYYTVLPYTVRITEGRQAVTRSGCADAGALLSSFLASAGDIRLASIDVFRQM